MEKQYSAPQCEKDMQELWQTQQTYSMAHNPGPLYNIDTPPPTVSGNLHIGHIFSYTQTDIIARYKRMNGFCVLYPFGFDDNGLATERFVEKKAGTSAYAMGRSAFIQLCLRETHHAEEQFKNLWQRMGLSVDWVHCYSTISEHVRRISQESFIQLYKKGYIYRKNEPALFCTTCYTSVAQAELDDTQKPTTFNDIVFKDNKGNDLIIATTRPELLPSVNAIFYHPDDIRYKHLKGTKATVPLFDFEVPLLEDEAVIIDKGTGLVMCSTFGDKTDIAWFKKHNLEYKPMIGFDGKFVAAAGPLLAGLKVPTAREKIIELLKQEGLLIKQTPITHAVNVHERCKKEIEYMLLPQWFLNILEYKQQFIEQADQINWYPAYMKTRYINWVENLSWDWCLSRQRFYGIPFPVWHCTGCGTIILAQQDQLPVDPQETPYSGTCPKCDGHAIIADTDVMDTWNTSSLTPYICAQFYDNRIRNPFEDARIKECLPMSMRPQAHDIIRTWAFYTIVKAWMHNKTVPWKDIVISGHVLSDAKEKLSKSKENASLTPEGLLQNYSADAIRYWTASGALGQDVAFSENQLKQGLRLTTKLWNAFRFIHEHTAQLTDQEKKLEPAGAVNEWIMFQASTTLATYHNYFNAHEFGLALDAVERFFWSDVCDNYLELIKDQLFNPDKYPAGQASTTRATLYQLGLRILQLYAPYIPHITDSIYQSLYKDYNKTLSLHQTKFEKVRHANNFEKSAQVIKQLINLIAQVRRLKTEKQLSLKTPLATLTIYGADAQQIKHIKEHEQLLKGIAQAAVIEYNNQSLDNAHLSQEGEQWHASISMQVSN